MKVELKIPYEVIIRRQFNLQGGTLELKFSSGVTITGLPMQADVLALLKTDLAERCKLTTTLTLEKEEEPLDEFEEVKANINPSPSQRTHTISCGECPIKDMGPAESFYCKDCKIYLCPDCLRAHSRENPGCFPILASQKRL